MSSPAPRAHRTASAPAAECTTVEEVCDWLAQDRPSLDDVAERLRHLIVAQREIGHVVDLLRQHVFAAIGEPSRSNAVEEQPF